jgi:hypothetical protein
MATVELVLFSLAFGVVLAAVLRSVGGPHAARRVWCVCAVGVAGGAFIAATLLMAADPDGKRDPAKSATSSPAKKFVKPEGWPAGHPLPLVASNCATCHLTAGRELTAAVVNFTRSVHDLNELSCADCHGGNTEDDVKAHEGEFGFIGTKKSAHIEGCSGCHAEEAEELAAGPHAWDFSQKINTEYPMCFDCHGNHDIGRPPEDFTLAAWCADCHDDPDKEFPNLAAVVAENDRLWTVLKKVHQKHIASTENPVPPKFREEVDGLRHATMHAVHKAREITPDEATKINDRAKALRTGLETWLQSKP